jgi:hypothetical protein
MLLLTLGLQIIVTFSTPTGVGVEKVAGPGFFLLSRLAP